MALAKDTVRAIYAKGVPGGIEDDERKKLAAWA